MLFRTEDGWVNGVYRRRIGIMIKISLILIIVQFHPRFIYSNTAKKINEGRSADR